MRFDGQHVIIMPGDMKIDSCYSDGKLYAHTFSMPREIASYLWRDLQAHSDGSQDHQEDFVQRQVGGTAQVMWTCGMDGVHTETRGSNILAVSIDWEYLQAFVDVLDAVRKRGIGGSGTLLDENKNRMCSDLPEAEDLKVSTYYNPSIEYFLPSDRVWPEVLDWYEGRYGFDYGMEYLRDYLDEPVSWIYDSMEDRGDHLGQCIIDKWGPNRSGEGLYLRPLDGGWRDVHGYVVD